MCRSSGVDTCRYPKKEGRSWGLRLRVEVAPEQPAGQVSEQREEGEDVDGQLARTRHEQIPRLLKILPPLPPILTAVHPLSPATMPMAKSKHRPAASDYQGRGHG